MLPAYRPALPIAQAGLSVTIFVSCRPVQPQQSGRASLSIVSAGKQDHESALYKFPVLIQREIALIFH